MELLHTVHFPSGEGPFPAIFALHGWGASAHDLIGLAPYLHGGEALVLCPQGPFGFEIGPGLRGYGWFPLVERGFDPGEFRKGAAALRAFVDQALERYPVERRKVVILGFSQGGVMGYDLALRDPGRFAGIAALSAWLPKPLSDSIPVLPEHAGMPVLVQHGTTDEMIDVARARESRDLLAARGVGLTYREYEMGHEIRPEALRDLVTWLEEKVLSPIRLVY
ncbi:MAG TPA: phospholipase [Deltaproteobacteria bacterium]|jgi:phospholipase/carboxylesterase|nr:phospholipase [Deltaproteobacteria bacterium]